MFRPTPLKRMLIFIFIDIITIIIGVWVAFLLRFDFNIPQSYHNNILMMMGILIGIKIPLFYLSGIYKISWRHFSFRDSVVVFYYSFFLTLFFTLLVYLFRGSFLSGFPRSVIPIEFFFSLFLTLSIRVSKRFYLEIFHKNALGTPILVIAKSPQAHKITRMLQEGDKYWPVAIFDNENSGVKINNVESKTLQQIQKYHKGIEEAIVSDRCDLKKVYEILKRIGIKNIQVYKSKNNHEEFLQSLTIADLLARHPVDLDKQKISEFIKGKVILVTGAGGSIGSEIVRQAIAYDAKQIILLDHSEYNLYKIEQEVEHYNIVPILQSITNKEGLEKVFLGYQIEIVIHAAAYKHVPLVELNVEEAIVNNIIGTKNVIDTAIKYGAKKVVLISTDKAVRPTNVMGTTKRICELYAQNVKTQNTEIVAVRFGNVLGSSGSVIPKFQQQIAQGKNLTVTHPEITRYFMLISEACELVLQAASIAKGSEIFILDMGEPIKIVDLAKKMIQLSGKDLQIEFTGLRRGEKLYEELLIDESASTTPYPSITVAKKTEYDIEKLDDDIKKLVKSEDKIEQLKIIVPEFHHQLNEG